MNRRVKNSAAGVVGARRRTSAAEKSSSFRDKLTSPNNFNSEGDHDLFEAILVDDASEEGNLKSKISILCLLRRIVV